MKKKYELTEETKTLDDGTVIHRIRAVRDFTLSDGTEIKAGDIGGWIEREDNLSHCGKAMVYGNAYVCGEARVYDKARVYGEARVFDKARVCDNADVFGDARVYGEAYVGGEARVCGEVRIYDKAKVCDRARVYGEARVCGDAEVHDKAYLCGNAKVKDCNDFAVFKNRWSSGRWFTYTRSDKMWTVGCFRGTGNELIAKAYKDSELSGQCYEAIVRAQEAIDKALNEAKEQLEDME